MSCAPRSLKERTDGEVQVHGGADLDQSLLALDLVDTVHLPVRRP
jgi:hypothetical protein